MYTIVWKKYLPVIKLLMKKAAGNDQVVGLNRTDFEKDKMARKTSARFIVNIVNGNAQNSSSIAPLARDLVAVLQQDEGTAELMRRSNFQFNMTSGYELNIHLDPREPRHSEVEQALAATQQEEDPGTTAAI